MKLKKSILPSASQRAISLIKTHRPTSPEDCQKIGIDLKWVGEGAFRQAFQIKRTKLLIKFPNSSYSISHARAEMRRIKRFQRERCFREFLPDVHYFDYQHGVIVMNYVRGAVRHNAATVSTLRLVEKMINQFMKMRINDFHWGNIRFNPSTEEIVLTDLGS